MYNYCLEYACYECIVTHEWENKQIMLQFQLFLDILDILLLVHYNTGILCTDSEHS